MATRLQSLARRSAEAREAELERCELCGEPLPPEHRHLMDLKTRELLCACQACKILFDRREAGVGHYRLVPERRLAIDGFRLDDPRWEGLRIPVEMAFFFVDEQGEPSAFYPSPAGPTESLLGLGSWEEIVRDNPVLETLEPYVEALLVNRARGARRHFLVPIEDAYRLVGLIRTRWRGLAGGREVWEEIENFFEELATRAKTVDPSGEELAWHTA